MAAAAEARPPGSSEARIIISRGPRPVAAVGRRPRPVQVVDANTLALEFAADVVGDAVVLGDARLFSFDEPRADVVVAEAPAASSFRGAGRLTFGVGVCSVVAGFLPPDGDGRGAARGPPPELAWAPGNPKKVSFSIRAFALPPSPSWGVSGGEEDLQGGAGGGKGRQSLHSGRAGPPAHGRFGASDWLERWFSAGYDLRLE